MSLWVIEYKPPTETEQTFMFPVSQIPNKIDVGIEINKLVKKFNLNKEYITLTLRET